MSDNSELEALAAAAAARAVEEYAERNQRCLSQADAKKLVEETVKATLLQIGIDNTAPIELQQDFQHLRQWRKAGQDIRSKGLGALIVIFVGGLFSLILVGIRHWFHGPN